MTYDQIVCFVEVVESKNFMEVAENLHISQSSLSKQIMKLERELGVLLLDRSKRSAVVTEAGIVFYRNALVIRRDFEHMLLQMDQFKQANNRIIRIGTLPIMTQYALTEPIQKFKKENAGIQVLIDEVEEDELKAGFMEGKYDYIITRENWENTDYLGCPITTDELIVVVSKKNELSKKTYVTMNECLNNPLILMKPYTSIYQCCMKIIEDTKQIPDIIRTARVESILSGVAINEGISFIPRKSYEIFQHENTVAISLEPIVELPVNLVWKNTKNKKQAKLLCSYLKEKLDF